MSEAWETEIKEKIDELIEDEDVTYNGILNCFQNTLIKKLQGHSTICIKPNEIVQDDKQGNILKIWNAISGSEKTFSVFIPSKYVPRGIWDGFRFAGEAGFATDELESYDNDDLEKTDLKVSLKLINHIKEYLKLKEEPSKKTCTDIWMQNFMERYPNKCMQKLIEKIASHYNLELDDYDLNEISQECMKTLKDNQ